MTAIKPSDHGIVVDNTENGRRYAISDRNYNPKVHRKVRDLRPGESVTSYRPKASPGATGNPTPTTEDAGEPAVGSGDSR